MTTTAPPGGWDALHQRFLETLRHARTFEIAVAARLLDAGLGVRLAEHREAPSLLEASRYGDPGDLLVENRWTVEIKMSAYRFTGIDDWPFPYGAYLASAENMARRQHVHPAAYVIVSEPTLAMVAVSSSTRQSWTTRQTRNDPDHAYAVVCAPRSALRPIDELVTALLRARDELHQPPAALGGHQ